MQSHCKIKMDINLASSMGWNVTYNRVVIVSDAIFNRVEIIFGN